MTKLLFLDIDGVLTTRRSRRFYNNPSRFDPDCIDAMQHLLVAMPELGVVLSSNWRRADCVGVGYTLEMFETQGLGEVVKRLVGLTPCSWGWQHDREIEMYLAKDYAKDVHYAVVDDQLISPQVVPAGHVFQTLDDGPKPGLTMQHVNDIVRWLNTGT